LLLSKKYMPFTSSILFNFNRGVVEEVKAKKVEYSASPEETTADPGLRGWAAYSPRL
jgi:hypothetical protein